MQSTAALIAVVRFSIAMQFTPEEHTVDDFVDQALVYHALRHPPAGDWTQAVQRAFCAIVSAKKAGRSAGWQIAVGKQELYKGEQNARCTATDERYTEVFDMTKKEFVLKSNESILTISGVSAMSDRIEIGTRVRKKSGSEWQGTVVGTYSTDLTPVGFCVESEFHPGSVQIYPAAALELMQPAPQKYYYHVCGIRHSAIVRAESPEVAIQIATQPGRVGDWENPTAHLIGSEMPGYYGDGL